MSSWKDWSDGTKWAMGIAGALLVSAIVGVFGYLFQHSALRAQDVSFSAESSSSFAIQSEFRGTASVRDDELSIEVEKAQVSYASQDGAYNGPRTILDLRVSLVEPSADAWRDLRQTALRKIDLQIDPGETVVLDPFTVTMSLRGLDSLANTWLVFDVNEKIPGDPEVGSSHAHSRIGQFSD